MNLRSSSSSRNQAPIDKDAEIAKLQSIFELQEEKINLQIREIEHLNTKSNIQEQILKTKEESKQFQEQALQTGQQVIEIQESQLADLKETAEIEENVLKVCEVIEEGAKVVDDWEELISNYTDKLSVSVEAQLSIVKLQAEYVKKLQAKVEYYDRRDAVAE